METLLIEVKLAATNNWVEFETETVQDAIRMFAEKKVLIDSIVQARHKGSGLVSTFHVKRNVWYAMAPIEEPSPLNTLG
jgi:hypothetical protein